MTGFFPRKTDFSIYVMAGFSKYEKPLANLGKQKTGKSCLYIKRLSDVDTGVLRQLVNASAEHMAK